MKKRVRAHTLQISKKCRLGVNDTYAFLPTEFTQSDNGKSLVYDHSTKTVVLEEGVGIDDGKTSSNSTWSSTKISTELGTKQPTITGSTNLTVNNLNANTSVNSTFINAHQFEVVNPNPGQLGYKLPTSIPAETKFLKSDAVSGQAYWGDAPTVPTIGATNLASNWNWDYNQNFILTTPSFTAVLPVSISPTNNLNNGYIVDNTNNIYKTLPGSWGNHKYSINVNIEPVDNHDYPIKVYAIYFKSNGLGWNYIKSVMTLFDLNILASTGHPGLGFSMLSEITDRPHAGFLSMYGAGSFSIPEESKNTYTGFVQSYISSILHVGGQIIPYGFTASGITFSPSIDPTFGSFNQLYSFDITTWFFYNGTTSPTYAQVNQYGARAGSWIILQSTSISGPPFTTVQTCLLVQSVNVTTGAVTFVNNSNLQDFVNSTGLLTNKTVLYVLNNWDQPIVANSNGYTIKATGLKTEIYQISPKGEAGENGVPGDPTLLIDDVNIDTKKTFSSSKINSSYQPTINVNSALTVKSLTTAASVGVGFLQTPEIKGWSGNIKVSDTLSGGTVSANTLTSTNTELIVSKSLNLNSTTAGQATIACGILTSTQTGDNIVVARSLNLNNTEANRSTLSCGTLSSNTLTAPGTSTSLTVDKSLNLNSTTSTLNTVFCGTLKSSQTSNNITLNSNLIVSSPQVVTISNGQLLIPNGYIDVGTPLSGNFTGIRLSANGTFSITPTPGNVSYFGGDVAFAGGSGNQTLQINTGVDATDLYTGSLQTRGGFYVQKTIFMHNDSYIRNKLGDTLIPPASVARQTGNLTISWIGGTGAVPGGSANPVYRAHVYNKTVILHIGGWIYEQGGDAAGIIQTSALPSSIRPSSDTEFPIRCRYNSTTYTMGHVAIRTDGLIVYYTTTTPNSTWPANATGCMVADGRAHTFTYLLP